MKKPENKLLLVAENFMLKFVLMILKKSIVTLKSLNLNQLLLIKKQLRLNQNLIACQNHQINITESLVKQLHYQWNYKMLLKKELLYLLNKILKKELEYWLINSVGIKEMHLKFGLLVLKIKVLISLLMPQKEFSSWTKLEILVNLLSNGQQERLQWLTNIWEVSELICLMLFFMLMLFIEVVVKLFPLQEDCIMLANWLLSQDF